MSHSTGPSLCGPSGLLRSRRYKAILWRSYRRPTLPFGPFSPSNEVFAQPLMPSQYPFAIVAWSARIPRFSKRIICFTVLYLAVLFSRNASLNRATWPLSVLGGWGIAVGLFSYILLTWWMVSYSEKSWAVPSSCSLLF